MLDYVPTLLNAILICAAVALSVPVAMFCLEVLLSLWPRRRTVPHPLPADSRLAVLIPAHNEESVIAATAAWPLLGSIVLGVLWLILWIAGQAAAGKLARQGLPNSIAGSVFFFGVLVMVYAFVARAEALIRDAGDAGITVAGVREGLGTTRKYAVPVLEFLDRAGVTRREGDLRFARRPRP